MHKKVEFLFAQKTQRQNKLSLQLVKSSPSDSLKCKF